MLSAFHHLFRLGAFWSLRLPGGVLNLCCTHLAEWVKGDNHCPFQTKNDGICMHNCLVSAHLWKPWTAVVVDVKRAHFEPPKTPFFREKAVHRIGGGTKKIPCSRGNTLGRHWGEKMEQAEQKMWKNWEKMQKLLRNVQKWQQIKRNHMKTWGKCHYRNSKMQKLKMQKGLGNPQKNGQKMRRTPKKMQKNWYAFFGMF